jgi:hypothetical protein
VPYSRRVAGIAREADIAAPEVAGPNALASTLYIIVTAARHQAESI